MGSLGSSAGVGSWPIAAAKALAVLAVLFGVFVVAPDRIAQSLDQNGTSELVRDLALVAWFGAGIVAVPWALARLQRGGRI